MYQVTIKNSGKVVTKDDSLSFTIAGFPPNTKLDFYISDCKIWKILGGDSIISDSNGGGNFSTKCEISPGKYRLSVRNYCYGTAYDDFTVVEHTTIAYKTNTKTTPATTTTTPNVTPIVASTTIETDTLPQEIEAENERVKAN